MNKRSILGLHILCDRCSKVLAIDQGYAPMDTTWKTIYKPKKGSYPHQMRFDFCDEKCRIVYFRGRKYWQRKLDHWLKYLRSLDGN